MSRIEVDTARLPLLLGELRLPAIARMWAEMAERSDREAWPAARLLSVLAELEVAERARRRMERHLAEARLPPDKTLDNFNFAHVPMARTDELAFWYAQADRLRTDRMSENLHAMVSIYRAIPTGFVAQ